MIKMIMKWYLGLSKKTLYGLEFIILIFTVYSIFIVGLIPELFQDIPVNLSKAGIKCIIAAAAAVIVFILVHILVYALRNFSIRAAGREKNRYTKTAFWLGSMVTAFPLAVYFIIFFPGAVSPDNIVQWEQVQSGLYSDWHPVYHTLMIKLFAAIVNHYAFIVFIQMAAMSFAGGYLLSVLAKHQFPVWCLVLCEGLIILNPHTRYLFLYLWKDSAFSIFMLLLCSYLIQVLLSRGEWLSRKRNVAAMGFSLLSVTMLRHNGILYSVPLLFFLCIFYRDQRKNSRLLIMGLLFCFVFIKYPLYNLLRVERPEQTYVESVGLPMTIMCNAKVLGVDNLDKKTEEMLEALGDDEIWNKYELGNYNSIKFRSDANEIVQDIEIREFLEMTLDTVKKNPAVSFQTLYQATRMVWDVRGKVLWDFEPFIQENEYGYEYSENGEDLRNKVKEFDLDRIQGIGKYIFSFIGVYLLLFMLSVILTFTRNGKEGVMLLLPVLCYNFGTMVLLCGYDFRFFYYNFFVTIPFCLTLFYKRESR